MSTVPNAGADAPGRVATRARRAGAGADPAGGPAYGTARGPRRTVGARWRADLRLARRQTLKNWSSSLLVIALVALPMALVAGALVFADGRQPTVTERITAELGQADASVRIVSGPDPSLSQYYDEPTWWNIARDDDTGVPLNEPQPPHGSAAPFLTGLDPIEIGTGSATVETAGGIAPMAAVVGDAGADALRGRFVLHEGRAATGDGEAMVSPGALERLGVSVGDTLTLTEPAGTYTITGVLSRAEDADAAEVVFLPGTAPNRAMQQAPEQTRWYVADWHPTDADVTRLNHEGLIVFARDLVLHPGEYAAPSYGTALWSIVALVSAAAAFAGYLVVLLAGAAFSVSARRQQRSLAVAASVGATRGDVFRIVLWQGSVLGLVGGIVGSAVGIGLGILLLRLLDDGAVSSFWGVHIPWGLLIAVVVFAVAVGTVAAIMPARAATKGEVIAALRGARKPVTVRVDRPLWGSLLLIVGIALTAASAGWLAAINAEEFVSDNDGRRIVCIWGIILGPIALQVGVMFAGHWIISLLAHALSRLGLAPRIASRDAAANPGRIVPAFAAIAACAFLAAASVGSLALVMHQTERGYWWGNPLHTMSVATWVYNGTDVEPPTPDKLAAREMKVRELLARTAPTATATVRVPADAARWDPTSKTVANPHDTAVVPQLQSFHDCTTAPTSNDCQTEQSALTYGSHEVGVVDADELETALGQKIAAADLARYRDGGALARDPRFVSDAGTIVFNELTVAQLVMDETAAPRRSVEVDAISLDQGAQHHNRTVFLSPTAAERIGIRTESFDVIAAYDEPPSVGARDAIARDANAMSTQAMGSYAHWEDGPADPAPWMLLVVGATAVLVIGASAVSLGLARVERRPDDATLAAVGGSRTLRRGIAAWQAVIVAGIGTITGVAAGVLPVWGVSMAAQGSYNPPRFSDMPWPLLAVLAFGLPVVIALVSWLVPPRHPDLTRRTAIA